jgi:hypothetical protein
VLKRTLRKEVLGKTDRFATRDPFEEESKMDFENAGT